MNEFISLHIWQCAKINIIDVNITLDHNYFSNCLPPVFDNYFDRFDHPHETRNGPNTIIIKRHSTEIAAASVLVKGAKLWNDLDISYKTLTKRNNFRAHFKSETLKLYY